MKNILIFVPSAFMFIAGLSLLCWDLRIRSVSSSLDNNTIDTIDGHIDQSSSSSSSSFEYKYTKSDIPALHNNNAHENIFDVTTFDDKTTTTKSGAKCLTFEETFDNLVASSSTIFLTMPAMAAGSSLQEFTKQCVGGGGGGGGGNTNDTDNDDNDSTATTTAITTASTRATNHLIDIESREQILNTNLVPPKIISSHMNSDRTLISMFQNIPRRSLIVYLYRNEHDRLFAAIRQVVLLSCKSVEETPRGVTVLDRGEDSNGNGNNGNGGRGSSSSSSKICTFDEKDMINQLIRSKSKEIGMGNNQIMTCDFYRAMEDNLPTMVFVHYTKADKLQNVLAKYHCPELFADNQPLHINTKESKSDDDDIQAYIRLSNDNDNGSGTETETEIELDEWMEAKRGLLEFVFQLRAVDREATTCQAKTRNMEDDLLGCDDGILEITRNTLF